MSLIKRIISSLKKFLKGKRSHRKRARTHRKLVKRKQSQRRNLRREESRLFKVKRKPSKTKKNLPKKQVLKSVKPTKAQKPGVLVGEVTHYFSKIMVCVIKVKGEGIKVGDQLHIQGSNADFVQKVESLQVESVNVASARSGQLVGLKVRRAAKPGAKVFKVK